MSRTKVEISAAIGEPDEHGRTEHPVSVRYRGADYSARVTFAVVNGKPVWGIGECSDQAFDAINAALASRADGYLIELLRAAGRLDVPSWRMRTG
jgi:hypothetical protein